MFFSPTDDHLVATVRKSLSWPIPHNINLHFSYPPPHQQYGSMITYVEILVNQVDEFNSNSLAKPNNHAKN